MCNVEIVLLMSLYTATVETDDARDKILTNDGQKDKVELKYRYKHLLPISVCFRQILWTFMTQNTKITKTLRLI